MQSGISRDGWIYGVLCIFNYPVNFHLVLGIVILGVYRNYFQGMFCPPFAVDLTVDKEEELVQFLKRLFLRRQFWS